MLDNDCLAGVLLYMYYSVNKPHVAVSGLKSSWLVLSRWKTHLRAWGWTLVQNFCKPFLLVQPFCQVKSVQGRLWEADIYIVYGGMKASFKQISLQSLCGIYCLCRHTRCMGQGFHFTTSEAVNSYLVIAIFHVFSSFSVSNI